MVHQLLLGEPMVINFQWIIISMTILNKQSDCQWRKNNACKFLFSAYGGNKDLLGLWLFLCNQVWKFPTNAWKIVFFTTEFKNCQQSVKTVDWRAIDQSECSIAPIWVKSVGWATGISFLSPPLPFSFCSFSQLEAGPFAAHALGQETKTMQANFN